LVSGKPQCGDNQHNVQVFEKTKGALAQTIVLMQGDSGDFTFLSSVLCFVSVFGVHKNKNKKNKNNKKIIMKKYRLLNTASTLSGTRTHHKYSGQT